MLKLRLLPILTNPAIVLVEQNARKALEMAERDYVLGSKRGNITGNGKE